MGRPVKTLVAITAVVALVGCGGVASSPRLLTSNAERVLLGPGAYVLEQPRGIAIATDRVGNPVKPKVTLDFDGVPTSNKWWSSLIWPYEPADPYSHELYAHPLALLATAEGLGLSYPDVPAIRPREYMYLYARDVLVGLEGMSAPDARVKSYSDWAVTAEWRDHSSILSATFGHGLPFVYFERQGNAPAQVLFDGTKPERINESGGVLALSVGNHHYGLFAPPGSSWERFEGGYRSQLNGKRFFSVAILPDNKSTTLELFRRHAYAFVRDTKVDHTYDEKTAVLTTRYALSTERVDGCAKTATSPDCEGISDEPLIALYRHQWLYTDTPTLDFQYQSPRGTMKVVAAASYQTRVRHNGLLPILPQVGERSLLDGMLESVRNEPDHFRMGLGETPGHDAYWEGKSFGRLASAVQIADELAKKDIRDELLAAMKTRLEDWFDGQEPRFFYYHAPWHSLVGLPASYGSARELNDHHFHYGYFVAAAATIARFDPAWAKKWAPLVNLLIQDVANHDRGDTRFPFLRHMDVYAGHSWANGPSQFTAGNNEEASSEDINLSSAIVLWGAATGNKVLRDLGLYLYTTQVTATEQYWFDVDRAVFPRGFNHPVAAMVWGAGAKYDTWFDQDPIMIHGINLLPFQGGSLYLGRRPDYVKRNFDTLLSRCHGEITSWRDYILMYLAVSDAKRATELYEQDKHFAPEFGNTMAMTAHWISNWKALGHLELGVTADIPTYAVFSDANGKHTYVASNPELEERTVSFSDGTTLDVPPRRMIWKRSSAIAKQ